MPAGRSRGTFRLSLIIVIIVAGAALLSILFYTFWQRLNRQVEVILQEQFNQQQLMLARKIADNVESYFDFLENALMGYAGLFQTTPPEDREMDAALEERFARHQRFGIMEIRRYNAAGVGVQVFSTSPTPPAPGSLTLPAAFLDWAQDPAHRGRLFSEQDLRLPRCPLEGPEGHAVLYSALLAGTRRKIGRGGGISHRPLFYLRESYGGRAVRSDRLCLDHRSGRRSCWPTMRKILSARMPSKSG